MNLLQSKQKKQDSVKNSHQQTGQSPGLSKENQHPFLQAQGIIGNHGILLRHSGDIIQAKLKIGQPNDKYEQEADKVAEEVMHIPESQLQLQDNKHRIKDLALNMKNDGEMVAAPALEAKIKEARGGGKSLDRDLRPQMELAFGTDFSRVRVHTNSKADKLNRELNALAFTTGNDIFFRQGAYNPGCSSDKALLAHELTHVVQQNSGLNAKLPIAGKCGDIIIQRVVQVPAAAAATAGLWGVKGLEAVEVVAALASVASVAGQIYPGGSGTFSYTSGAADRLSEKTQPKNKNYKAVCLIIDAFVPGPLPDNFVLFHIIWQGNDYGEIGAARVRVDIERTSEFMKSLLTVNFRPLKNLIQPGADKRTWRMEWDYEGTLDLAFAGEYWFQGGFAIDAFGNFIPFKPIVRDLSLGAGTAKILPGIKVSYSIPPPPKPEKPKEVSEPKKVKEFLKSKLKDV